MKLKHILLKLFPYIAGLLCALAIIIFVLTQMSAIGWYAILTTLVMSALLIWRKALVESRIDERITRDQIRTIEDRLRDDEYQIDALIRIVKPNEDEE